MPSWFPVGRDGPHGWRLDVVALLAVIGDTSIRYHAQPMTASWHCLLPRLVPAPQALLTFRRLSRLPAAPAKVSYSGVVVDDLNFYGNLRHEIDKLKPFEFQEWQVKHKKDRPQGLKEIAVSKLSLLSWLAVLSCLGTFALLGWALHIDDGVAALGIGILAMQSSIVGMASWWKPGLSTRTKDTKVPDGRVVIRTREGAFIVVECSDEVARELYIGTEVINYRLASDQWSKVLMMLGILGLMIGVILLGNSSWTMQAAIGSSYVLLNALYWIVALCPAKWVWDLTGSYDFEQIKEPALSSISKDKNVEESFAQSMWYAIFSTKATQWALSTGAAPKTKYWEEWLVLADKNIYNKDWDAVRAKDRLMEKANREMAEQETQRRQRATQTDQTDTNSAQESQTQPRQESAKSCSHRPDAKSARSGNSYESNHMNGIRQILRSLITIVSGLLSQTTLIIIAVLDR